MGFLKILMMQPNLQLVVAKNQIVFIDSSFLFWHNVINKQNILAFFLLSLKVLTLSLLIIMICI